MFTETPALGQLALNTLEKRLETTERLNRELMGQLTERLHIEEMLQYGWEGERILNQLMRGIIEGLPAKAFRSRVLDQVQRYCREGFAYYADVRRDSLVVVQSRGRESTAPLKSPLPLEKVPSYLGTLSSGALMVVPDVEAEDHLRPLSAHFLVRRISALLEAPILLDQRLVGVLGIGCEEPHLWTAPEKRLLSEVASLMQHVKR